MTSTRNLIGLLALLLALTGAADLGAADDAKGSVLPKDWPNWRGPICSGVTGDCGEPLVDDLSKAKLLWTSEEDVPANAWSGGRHGSYDSPVIADGKVFLGFQYGPGPSIHWKDWKKAVEAGTLTMDQVLVVDYVILAIDAMTGKTVWRTVVDRVPNTSEIRKRPGGHHAPCFWKGKVYAQSTLGRIYCLDAGTGKMQWQVDGYKTADHIRIRDLYLETGKRHRGMHQVEPDEFKGKDVPKLFTHGYPVIVVDGVVIADAAPRIDATTGKVLGEGFRKPANSKARGGDHCEPLRWAVDGQEYVIKGGLCYEPRSGKERWKIKVRSERCPAVGDGYAVYATGWKDTAALVAYAITPDGATERWRIDGLGCRSPGVIHGGWYYGKVSKTSLPAKEAKTKGDQVLIAVELATGKHQEIGRMPGKSGQPSMVATAAGRLVFYITHGDRFGLHMAERRADGLHLFPGFLNRAATQIAHGSSPAIADGRLYIRCQSDLKCYDLRASAAEK